MICRLSGRSQIFGKTNIQRRGHQVFLGKQIAPATESELPCQLSLIPGHTLSAVHLVLSVLYRNAFSRTPITPQAYKCLSFIFPVKQI